MEIQKSVILSDTDSAYIHLAPVIKHIQSQGIEVTPELKIKFILELANKIQLSANKNLNGLCEKLFHIEPNTHYFQLKQEVIASSLLTTGKRRYGMWVTNKEGVDVDELDLKGLEVMKSNMNKIFKTFGEEFIKKVILDTPRNEIDKFIIDFYKQIKNTEPKLIGKPMGVSFIKKCIKRKPNSGMIFSELNMNTKENSRAAIYYNDLLKFKKLDTKYESIIEGDKIFIFNLIKNPYQINVIGMPNNEIPKEIEEFIKVHIDYDKIFESSILNKLKELYSDLGWSFPSLNPYTSKFFSF
jgi:histidinol phosphatase-like enzyme